MSTLNRMFLRFQPKLRAGVALFAASALLACASAPSSPPAAQSQVYDPWEGYNRAVFSFNEKFDQYIFRPVAVGYVDAVPEYGRERVHNVLTNLKQPIYFLNSVLQGDPGNAFSSLWTFVLNSTFGVLGVFDFAGSNTDLRVHPEDFGQTLGVWGVGTGPYFVLPLLGPSTVRDTAGLGVDWYTDPLYYYADNYVYYTRLVVQGVDTRAGLIDTLDDVHHNSVDPYATLRSGYFQQRAALIKNNRVSGASSAPGFNLDPAGGNASSTDPAAQAEKEGIIP